MKPATEHKSHTVNPEKMLTVSQAAEKLGVSLMTLYSWRASKTKLDFYRDGYRVYYDPADIEAYMEAPSRRQMQKVVTQ